MKYNKIRKKLSENEAIKMAQNTVQGYRTVTV